MVILEVRASADELFDTFKSKNVEPAVSVSTVSVACESFVVGNEIGIETVVLVPVVSTSVESKSRETVAKYILPTIPSVAAATDTGCNTRVFPAEKSAWACTRAVAAVPL